MFDPKAFAQHAWQDFVTSKTVKTVIGAEVLACTGFVYGLIDGTIPRTKASLIAFGATQVASVVALTLRHALAEIRAQVGGQVSPEMADAIQAMAVKRAFEALAIKHPEAAAVLKTEFERKV